MTESEIKEQMRIQLERAKKISGELTQVFRAHNATPRMALISMSIVRETLLASGGVTRDELEICDIIGAEMARGVRLPSKEALRDAVGVIAELKKNFR